jgi:uncharacterized protein (DUF433 family)
MNMVMAAEQLLGVGLYTVEEAAFYARVNTQTMARWIFGDRRGQAVMERQFSKTDEKIVTFLDFIQAIHIKQIRADTECRIPLPKIREAIDVASRKYGVHYPLAMEHTTYFYGKEIAIAIGDDQNDPNREFVQLTGKTKHQGMIGKIVRLYAKDLTFDQSGLANSFKAGEYGGVKILMKPSVRFGEPIVVDCGYTARTLYEATITEGSFESAASAYGVLPLEVESGYRHIQSLANVS